MTSRSQTVHIAGAGLSGMAAAINLARAGHSVVVLEAAKSIGGVHPHHPSNHSTPINLRLMKDYVGLDLTPVLHSCNSMLGFIRSCKYEMPSWPGFSVERGPRKTSIDSLLYEEALRLGVKFELGQELKDPFDLPDPAILATGLFRGMNELLGRPVVRLPCFSARTAVPDPSRNGDVRTWFGRYTNTYAYASIINQLGYYLLFSDRDLTLLELRNFEEELERTEGVRFDHWDYFEVFVPMGRPDAPRLFAGSKILAGTLAGMMEPGLYFGIHGALVSGKIAALAVDDPVRAYSDFRRFTRGFARCWYANRWLNNPQRQYVMAGLYRFPGLIKPLLRFADTGIPGIDHYYTDMNPRYAGRF
ncbi:MAG: NAD(P)-binding protein [bacterium]